MLHKLCDANRLLSILVVITIFRIVVPSLQWYCTCGICS